MLQVGVDRDDRVAPSVVEAGGERDLLAEVARQRDDAYPRIAGGERGSTASVASRLPSSTNTASAAIPSASSASDARAQNDARPAASL